MTVLVLWENHVEGAARRFGPHSFLVAAVTLQLGKDLTDRYAVADSVDFRTCNGNSKLLALLAEDLLWAGGRRVVAVLDRDKIHRALDVPAARPDDEVRAQIVGRAHPACRAALDVVLLDANVETLLEHVNARPALLADARGKKSRNQAKLARDAILERAATDALVIANARQRVPSFDALVRTVAGHLRDR